MTVVEDRDDLVTLWCPKGAIRKCASTPPHREWIDSRAERLLTSLSKCDWVMKDKEWDVSTLWLMRPDDWHAVWVSWHDNGEPWGWYINLQDPFRRTSRGFRTMDLMLDIVVERDRTWAWKDVDDFEGLLERGLIDLEIDKRVRDEAQRVIERIEANGAPFSQPFHDWRPDASWGIPVLPPNWEDFDG